CLFNGSGKQRGNRSAVLHSGLPRTFGVRCRVEDGRFIGHREQGIGHGTHFLVPANVYRPPRSQLGAVGISIRSRRWPACLFCSSVWTTPWSTGLGRSPIGRRNSSGKLGHLTTISSGYSP